MKSFFKKWLLNIAMVFAILFFIGSIIMSIGVPLFFLINGKIFLGLFLAVLAIVIWAAFFAFTSRD